MKLLSIAAAAAILTVASAAPPTLSARAGNSATCKYTDSSASFTLLDLRFELRGRFLDNLHGRCRKITNWTFDYPNGVGRARFAASSLLKAGCVEDAIWLASKPTGAIRGVDTTFYATNKTFACKQLEEP
ncbi:hypothetical protein BZA05DRAFT_448999 [Tricharina praecox]|uniref:uncharacterized protein n=1 Tax=Tricharina praecox TaxID=43433 RepID=UPI00221EB4E5|nr:uncharacterized protein BZA05DRAFT_448999 [Tricharina praecox]KAI5842743.1 hypothetical protein BZA05DRAFT_448999 [Tricharina praecox]